MLSSIPFLDISFYSSPHAYKIMLPWNRIAYPVSVAYRVWEPLIAREHLPIMFYFKVIISKPVLYQIFELPQFSFVRPEHGKVIHIPGIMSAESALSDCHIQRLQSDISKPL